MREAIRFAAPDDDIDYTLLGMLNLEQNGLSFTHQDLKKLWLRHQSLSFCWGPERTILLRCGLSHWGEGIEGVPADDFAGWVRVWNPNDQLCGAVIRADAYGYACPGDPATAAELAWRDASFTHRKTGVYATMFVAAAIAAAYVASDPLDIFRVALQYVPRRSRFFQIVSDSFQKVAGASDWLEGYELIHGKYREFSHCQVYQECGTLINTLRFASSIDDGFCKTGLARQRYRQLRSHRRLHSGRVLGERQPRPALARTFPGRDQDGAEFLPGTLAVHAGGENRGTLRADSSLGFSRHLVTYDDLRVISRAGGWLTFRIA